MQGLMDMIVDIFSQKNFRDYAIVLKYGAHWKK